MEPIKLRAFLECLLPISLLHKPVYSVCTAVPYPDVRNHCNLLSVFWRKTLAMARFWGKKEANSAPDTGSATFRPAGKVLLQALSQSFQATPALPSIPSHRPLKTKAFLERSQAAHGGRQGRQNAGYRTGMFSHLWGLRLVCPASIQHLLFHGHSPSPNKELGVFKKAKKKSKERLMYTSVQYMYRDR